MHEMSKMDPKVNECHDAKISGLSNKSSTTVLIILPIRKEVKPSGYACTCTWKELRPISETAAEMGMMRLL